MAITIDYGNTNIIYVPQSYLALVSGTIYSMDTNAFRLAVKTIEASEEGMPFPDTNIHNTEVIVAGVTYARAFSILSPYSIEFEDLQYTVLLNGSNNNVWDVQGGFLNQNQAQIIPSNSAGLIVSGSGVTPTDKTDIIDGVWSKDISASADSTAGGVVNKILTFIYTLLR